MSAKYIQLRGVEVHNLKSVDLDLPLRQLIVFCGVSGSGKTSLALDTLYAEGQRRYIESFSAYTRQFLERLEKPACERIDGIPPAIAVTRKHGTRSNRATIGSVTETADYLRLLFAKIGHVFCQGCGREVRRDTPQTVAQRLDELAAGTRGMLTFPLCLSPEDEPAMAVGKLKEAGFVRVVVGHQTVNLSDGTALERLLGQPEHGPWYVVVDRLTIGSATPQRLRDSLETAFAHGGGKCCVFVGCASRLPAPASDSGTADPTETPAATMDGQDWQRLSFSASLSCDDCGRSYPEPEPRLYDFNSPLGACPQCEGFGDLVDMDLPNRWRTYRPCLACGGKRLRPEALATRIGGRDIAEVSHERIEDARAFFQSLPLPDGERRIGRVMLEQVESRLRYLCDVGLGYLALDRTLRTLSGGETQRVAMTSVLGSSLVNMLYVLDEPSVGLHPRDVDRLADAVAGLRDRGNTVVVTEHEETLLRRADQIIEIGPGAGERGGAVVFQGTPEELLAPGASLTGEYLSGRRGASLPERRRPAAHGRIQLTGARGNNLKNLTVEFPLGVLCLVTGVSGAGKSTLVQDTLYGALCRRKRKDAPPPCPYDDVFGDGQIDDVMLVDQSPISPSPRSNPVTYIKAFDQIRQVFADTVEARTHNYTASHFSFNVDGGRCEACEGAGYLEIDMQFLPDVYMQCSRCGGTRYRKEILEVTYRGLHIAEVLDLTVREAFGFFRGQMKVQTKLKQLIDVGLDYLRLGQPANTLSSGEAQRLKLASYLSAARRKRTLFLLDEPTTGLHFSDIVKLLDGFEALLAVGHSLIVIEHNLQVMKAADYIIDLGPGAGEQGGQVIVQGPPETIAQHAESVTGRYLRESLAANGFRGCPC